LHVDGLHNVYRVSDRVFSGSGPDGDAGFAALRELGVNTVVSVDGARPDVAGAARHGLRYVHLPVGYHGIPREQVLRLAKAVRDLPGPVYVHCHHGRHRGPAAAAAVQLCLDPGWTPDRAEAWMTAAGTDPKYTGLTGLPKSLVRPTADELDRLPVDFPATATVPDLTRLMVDVDARWDHLRLAKAAGWVTPKGHPDVDPPHEAVMLAELYREAVRLSEVKAKGGEFLKQFADAEAAAAELSAAIRGKDADAAAKAFAECQAACAGCHQGHRDRR
jgi:protein tyrosine phosphatase (PTP) superfamily phosphohydrolase (DUF442 family)